MNIRKNILEGETITQIAEKHNVQEATVRTWMRGMYKRNTPQGMAAYKKLVAQAKANERLTTVNSARKKPVVEPVAETNATIPEDSAKSAEVNTPVMPAKKKILLVDKQIVKMSQEEFIRLSQEWEVCMIDWTESYFLQMYAEGRNSFDDHRRVRQYLFDGRIKVIRGETSRKVTLSRYYSDVEAYTIKMVKTALNLRADIFSDDEEIREIALNEGLNVI